MASLTEDQDIRLALADLTEAQPPVPGDRFAAVRRRAVRHRRRQLVGAVCAVAVAVVVAGLTALPRLSPAPQATRHVPRWALDWTDHRNGSVPQSVLDGAVVSWLWQEQAQTGCCNVTGFSGPLSARQTERLAARYLVVWYAGQTVDRGQSVVVMFEADGPAGPQLIVGQATASEVMRGQAAVSGSSSSWALTVVQAPDPRRAPAEIGTYVPGSEPADRNQNPDNWMVVLTAPEVTRLSWEAGTPDGTRRITTASSGGLVVTDNGQITTAVELTGITTVHGFRSLSPPRPVGVPGDGPDHPELAAPAELSLPASFSWTWGITGPGPTTDEGPLSAAQRQHAFYGICYGTQPVQINVDGHRVGTLSCDSQQHEIPVPRSAFTSKGHQIMAEFGTGYFTSLRILFGFMRSR